jgi:catechol 2,3-dioxygenase-like lactoylglutathione lyase family enzyme
VNDEEPEVTVQPLHHVGYWVDDLDEAVDRAVRALGVGPFLVHRNIRFRSFVLADGTPITDPAYFDHTAAFASWGSIVLELGVVHAAHPDIVAAYGIRPGATGHVSWVVDDLDAESARLASLGCALIHTASLGAVNVAWHDGGDLFPHPIEVHLAGAPILGMHDRLAALARDWDGSEPLRPMGP